MECNVLTLERPRLDLIGQFVEVRWAPGHVFAQKQCDRCVYAVRGLENDMICLDLVYDAAEGIHRKDAVYWVNILSVSYLRVLTEREAARRIETLEREVHSELPRD